jgi:hypothetical protein
VSWVCIMVNWELLCSLFFYLHFVYEYFRLHHRAGSKPIELHGSVYEVICLDCGTSISRESFQEQVKDLNPKVCPFDTGYIFFP